jgi:hypothetical protein
LDVVERDEVVLQIHYVSHPQPDMRPLYTLAINLGANKIVRRINAGGIE